MSSKRKPGWGSFSKRRGLKKKGKRKKGLGALEKWGKLENRRDQK